MYIYRERGGVCRAVYNIQGERFRGQHLGLGSCGGLLMRDAVCGNSRNLPFPGIIELALIALQAEP